MRRSEKRILSLNGQILPASLLPAYFRKIVIPCCLLDLQAVPDADREFGAVLHNGFFLNFLYKTFSTNQIRGWPNFTPNQTG